MAESIKKKSKRAAAAVADTPGVDCSLEQLTLFDCNIETLQKRGVAKCYPIPRVFRVCRDRPAVEVTALLRYKDSSGEPYLPEDYLEHLPKGKSWKEIASNGANDG